MQRPERTSCIGFGEDKTVFENFKCTKDLTRHNDVNHGRDSLQGKQKKKGGRRNKQTHRQILAQTHDDIQLEIQKHYAGQKQHSHLIFYT